MDKTFKQCLTATERITIDASRTITFMGEDLRVYSTPSMVLDIERLCKKLLDKHLDKTESSVGTRVEINHLGATLINMWVDIEIFIKEIDRRRILFEVEIQDQVGDKVGECLHTRFVVDLERQKKRLDSKRAKLETN